VRLEPLVQDNAVDTSISAAFFPETTLIFDALSSFSSWLTFSTAFLLVAVQVPLLQVTFAVGSFDMVSAACAVPVGRPRGRAAASIAKTLLCELILPVERIIAPQIAHITQ
jgi:hypothetical protein